MKHLVIIVSAITVLITLIAAGCSEPTSRTRTAPAVVAPISEASEPVDEPEPSPTAVVEAPAPAEAPEAPESSSATTEPAEAPEVAEVDDEPETESEAAINLELMRVTMAQGVERYEPVGAAETFSASDAPDIAFLQVANHGPADHQVVISYEHESGRSVGPARLDIPAGSRGYRTFTRTPWVRHPGQWTVTVSTADGVRLGQREFTIES